MKNETRDKQIKITCSWAHRFDRFDLTKLTISYNCIRGTLEIDDSALLAPDRFSENEVRRVEEKLKTFGLKTMHYGQYNFQFPIHQLKEIDEARKRPCTSSLEAMLFLNSIAAVFGKEPDTCPRVTVSRECLVGNAWVEEGRALYLYHEACKT